MYFARLFFRQPHSGRSGHHTISEGLTEVHRDVMRHFPRHMRLSRAQQSTQSKGMPSQTDKAQQAHKYTRLMGEGRPKFLIYKQ